MSKSKQANDNLSVTGISIPSNNLLNIVKSNDFILCVFNCNKSIIHFIYGNSSNIEEYICLNNRIDSDVIEGRRITNEL